MLLVELGGEEVCGRIQNSVDQQKSEVGELHSFAQNGI